MRYKAYQADNISLDTAYNSDELEVIIAPFREDVYAEMGGVIGNADTTLMKFAPESPLGNFAADVVFEKGMTLKSDVIPELNKQNTIALINFGGLRAPINAGEITIGNVYELMPFDNTITIVELSPEKMREMCTYLVTVNGQPVSNAQFNLSKDHVVRIGDVVYNFDKPVNIITSNYLADGGDKMTFFKSATKKWDSGLLMRDVFIAYIKEKGEIGNYPISGRIKIGE